MKDLVIRIDEIYVPASKRGPVDAEKVNALAESIAENGLQSPILVRPDKARYVLVSGLHRLEACKALGETTIKVNLVQATKH
ncbi:MAG TPA: ParB N-terminal domain-containing protein [Candidatus Cybelea sp.]|nr:ParB N-terminal domain-containing protein [Candidatus Cybelea sp.]